MKKYILTVTLNPALDKTYYVSSLKKNQKLIKEKVTAGGKGVNVARALKNLRVSTVATGFLGGEAGQKIRELLDQESIPNSFERISKETRVNDTLIQLSTNSIRRKIRQGSRISSKEGMLFRKRYKQLLKKAKFVILSGRNAPGLPDSFFRTLICLARAQGIPVLLDTSGQPLKVALTAKPLIAKPNQQEAQEVLGVPLKSSKDFLGAINAFHGRGIKIVLLSLGKDGAIGSDGKTVVWYQTPVLNVKNDVGCGDALVAGFVAEYLKGKGFKQCVKMAVACGSANTKNMIPGQICRQDIREVIKKVERVF